MAFSPSVINPGDPITPTTVNANFAGIAGIANTAEGDITALDTRVSALENIASAAFVARLASDQSIASKSSESLAVKAAFSASGHLNEGTVFVNADNQFVAPQDGKYAFFVQMTRDSTSDTFNHAVTVSLWKTPALAPSTPAKLVAVMKVLEIGSTSGSYTASLLQGDKIDVRVFASDNYTGSCYVGSTYTQFSGYKL